MPRMSDKEFVLKRQVRDLEQRERHLNDQIRALQKRNEKLEHKLKEQFADPEVEVVARPQSCPDCGGKLLITAMPHATLSLCMDKCGYRLVKSN